MSFSNPETWIWSVVGGLAVLGLLTRNKVVGALAGLAFCGAALYILSDRTVGLVNSIHACTASTSWECIPLALGDAMPVPILIGLGLFAMLKLIALLWVTRKANTQSS